MKDKNFQQKMIPLSTSQIQLDTFVDQNAKLIPMQESIYPNDQKIPESLEFILNHFEDPQFPRTVSTRATNGKQKNVNSKDEAFARFKQANYIDCRINAFPDYTEHNDKNIQKSNFIFIDLDRNQSIQNWKWTEQSSWFNP